MTAYQQNVRLQSIYRGRHGVVARFWTPDGRKTGLYRPDGRSLAVGFTVHQLLSYLLRRAIWGLGQACGGLPPILTAAQLAGEGVEPAWVDSVPEVQRCARCHALRSDELLGPCPICRGVDRVRFLDALASRLGPNHMRARLGTLLRPGRSQLG